MGSQHVPNHQPFASCLLSFQCLLPKAACLPTFTSPSTTTPVSNSCTCSGLQPGHWADQRGGIRRQQGPYCHKVEKVIFKNKCEPYKEKTCFTQNEEICEPVMYKNYTGVIETNIERVCFNVNELVCNLVEAVHYETLEETYQVQRCFTGKDRVCDTTYDIDTTTK